MNLNDLVNELQNIANEWNFNLMATTATTDKKILKVTYWVEDSLTGLPTEVTITVERTLKLDK